LSNPVASMEYPLMTKIRKKTHDTSPSTNGVNGGNSRGTNGRFLPGNPGGPGNPHVHRVAELRSTFFEVVTKQELRAVIRALLKKAKAGDIIAARELLDRCLGKPQQTVDIDLEVDDKPKEKSLDEMSDLELAEIIVRGGIELPPILKKKVENIYNWGQKHPEAKQER